MQGIELTLAAMRKLGTWRFNFFVSVMSVQGKSARRTQTKIVENTTLMRTQTCTRQLVLDQHNKSQSHYGLLKLHLVSKMNLRKRLEKLNHCRGGTWNVVGALKNLTYHTMRKSHQSVTDNQAHRLFHDVFTTKDSNIRNKIVTAA